MISPSHGGELFLDFGVLKPGFWCVIIFKLTSILDSNLLMMAVYIRGGGPFLLLSNVLDTKGEGVGGDIPLPRWGTFFGFGGTIKPGFWCIIRFELTSILAPNV